MKKLYLILTLIIAFCIISCTSDNEIVINDSDNEVVISDAEDEVVISDSDDDDDDDDDSEVVISENVKLLKKVERYQNNLFYEKTVNYDADNKIKSFIINKYIGGVAPYHNAITVDYSKESISTINDFLDYEDPLFVDKNVLYKVSIENDLITLNSENVKIEITHTNGFVDSMIEYSTDNSRIIREAYLTRDSIQNLTSITFSRGHVDTYSNFDSGKKPDPDGIVIGLMNREYITILGLQLTANNPKTFSQVLNSGTTPVTINYTYEYDEDGYISKTIDHNFYSDTFYIEE
jgi:uncharacterized protein YcfL